MPACIFHFFAFLSATCFVLHLTAITKPTSPQIRKRMEARLTSLAHQALARAQHFIHTTLRKGENFELKSELNSEYEIRRREAVKRVIANMTVGKDCSTLFADVVKNMQTENREMKKLGK